MICHTNQISAYIVTKQKKNLTSQYESYPTAIRQYATLIILNVLGKDLSNRASDILTFQR